MKKILFIYKKPIDKPIPEKQQHHFGWVKDCSKMYKIKFWGLGFSDTSLQSLKKEIDRFKPDFIYMTMRKRYCDWLPDMSSIKVPKIFVECDSYKWHRTDSWYDQFDTIYCRQAWWKPVFYSRNKQIHPKFVSCAKTWNHVPMFKWSVPEAAFPTQKPINREGIYIMGAVTRSGYTDRKMLYNRFKGSSKKNRIQAKKIFGKGYWPFLHKAAALLCPTESNFGAFVPSKLFEYLSSGTAVITNCDLDLYGTPELKPLVIQYTDLDNLEYRLTAKFRKFHDKAIPIMRKLHTHEIRYKELFG